MGLKTFLKVFPAISINLLFKLISWNFTPSCLAVTGGGNTAQWSKLSKLSWASYTCLLTYFIMITSLR